MEANGRNNMAMMPAKSTLMDKFRGSETSGKEKNVHKLTLARLDAGDAAFVIESPTKYKVEGRIQHVRKHLKVLQ